GWSGAAALGNAFDAASMASNCEVSGIAGNFGSLGVTKSKAEVRSLLTARCHGEMPGMVTPKRFSINCPTEVWSATAESTHPPLLQGDRIYIGTRGPMPQGRRLPEMVSRLSIYTRLVSVSDKSSLSSWKYIPATSIVDLPASVLSRL